MTHENTWKRARELPGAEVMTNNNLIPLSSLTIRPSEASAWPALDGPHEVVGYTPHKVTIDVDGIECTYPREVLRVVSAR